MGKNTKKKKGDQSGPPSGQGGGGGPPSSFPQQRGHGLGSDFPSLGGPSRPSEVQMGPSGAGGPWGRTTTGPPPGRPQISGPPSGGRTTTGPPPGQPQISGPPSGGRSPSGPPGQMSAPPQSEGPHRVGGQSEMAKPPAVQMPTPTDYQRPESGKGKRNKKDRKDSAKEEAPKTGKEVAGPNQPKSSGHEQKAKDQSVKSKESTPAPQPAKATSTMDVTLLQIPLRRQNADRTAKAGKKIKVDVNHMAIKLQNYEIIAYHYDCVFVPEKPKFLLRKAMNEFFKQKFPGKVPVFDGVKNLYSNGPLIPDDRGASGTISVFNEESQRDKEFTITIAVVNRIDMRALQRYQSDSKVNAQMALTVMDLALRSFSADKLVSSGRKFFSPPEGRVIQLGDGIELWHGHFQSASLGWKPYLCVDISHKGFYETHTIPQYIAQVLNSNPEGELNEYGRKDLESHLKGLRVDYEIPGMANSKRSYRVNGVVGSPKNEAFEDDDKKKWTVLQYYAQQKNCRLKYPNIPCLWVGSRDKKIRIPGELCKISPGQAYNRKYNERQTSQMVRAATSNTDERRDHIMHAYKNTGMTPQNPFLREFGISVSGQFERVEGRVLDAPLLEYGNQSTVYPDKGTWRAPQFMVPKGLTDWAILNLNNRTRDDELRNLSKLLSSQSASYGMNITNTNNISKLEARDKRGIENYFRSMKGKQIVFVCVPDSGDTYAIVKKIAEITVGVLTQCIKGRTVQRINASTIGNILLKVNAKLDGVNHSFAKQIKPPCLNRPVMIVGADVTHPAPGQMGVPSIAAVAASHDPKAFKYNMIWRMQPKGEMIVDLENIMKEQLMFFHRVTKYKPEKILFFRDGVSDGEIQKVMSLEIRAIRRACNVLEQGYEPKITFLVVQKRHHTRFFPTDKRDCYDRKNFNLPAGTVVDTEIVHPHETEFLLLSHASILGTARPTKYRLVWDDSDFYENELEQLSYYLCHMFTRCTRSVSYPAPTYYAHLAAFRARSYLDAERITNINDLAKEQDLKKMNAELMTASPMFFV